MPTHFYNEGPPAGGLPDKDVVRREFGRRLYQAISRRGWNQSELARQAARHMPDMKFGRDCVSTYVRGLALPSPSHLNALCKALDMVPQDLLPSRVVPSVDMTIPPFEMTEVGGGKARLRVNTDVSWTTAAKILLLLDKVA
jgi:transcriptional regulator with XRE-family HTH domain